MIVTSSGRLPKALQSNIAEGQTLKGKSPLTEELSGPESEDCPFFCEEDGLRLLGGNIPLYHKVLREYCTENTGLIAELSSQIESGSFAEAAKTVHKVKGSSGNIGAKRFYTVASKLQKALESDSPEIGELFEKFRQTFEQVMLYISKLGK